MKPILNINNPKAITPGGAYFLMGLEPQIIGNRSQLRQNYRVNFALNSQSNAAWNNLQIIRDVCAKNEDGSDMFYAIGGKYISRHKTASPALTTYGAILHTINDDGDINYCYYPGIINTETGNMLYTGEQNLGIAYYGRNLGSNFTNKIIDSAGRNLTALNGMTVINLKDLSTATITSVGDANATGDQLNFTGNWSGSNDIDDGEEWVVFNDTFKDLNTATYPHFAGQDYYYQWNRPIINFYGEYFVGHGNYIAKLSNDETTWDEDYTQLPSFMQLNCMDVVGNNIFIGGEKQGKGMLVVWNGVTPNNYVSIINLPAPVYSVKEHRGGAIVLAGSALYWTDGYSTKLLSNLPGTEGDWKIAVGHSSMLIENDSVYINAGVGDYTDAKKGVWVYRLLNNSWIYNPCEDSAGKKILYGSTVGGVFNVGKGGYNAIFASYEATYPTLSNIQTHATNNYSMAVFSYNSPKNTQINYVDLVLGQTMNERSATPPTATITVALSDGKKPFWMYGQVRANASNADEIPIDGSQTAFNKASVGDLIIVLDGARAGEYAFVSSITNDGTNTAILNLDRELTGVVAENNSFQIISCRKAGEHSITDYFSQPLSFTDGLLVSGDFYLIILIKNTVGNIDIRDIALY